MTAADYAYKAFTIAAETDAVAVVRQRASDWIDGNLA
jgi:hypothetical protein